MQGTHTQFLSGPIYEWQFTGLDWPNNNEFMEQQTVTAA